MCRPTKAASDTTACHFASLLGVVFECYLAPRWTCSHNGYAVRGHFFRGPNQYIAAIPTISCMASTQGEAERRTLQGPSLHQSNQPSRHDC